ncbi:hypothetical protein P7D22_05525 [Lichenihabitans sp. Uapishka_5]|uniref:hypothetical protein n=1 Tax=Lichenihabitans sp. Uapishka_5 TaxID=3037302 RepID=UPI0029E7FD76|nr:hypothetical protein [Lichenihabitans sp. Uapishka_5]MDX7950638.1 hypothetical protein [Lichenihabitans sp. Uapishka_5]
MIEDALFALLGFCAAVVLALACLPLLWARALRLTRQRLALLVPWSKGEIDAERDGLRAQAAVEARRLEQQVERSRATAAARAVALGQQTVQLVRSEAALEAARQERTVLIGDIDTHARALRDADGQRFATEKALHDADRRIESDAVAASAQMRRLDQLGDLAEERRGSIAALETRVAGLLATLEDKGDALVRLDAALAQVTQARATVAAEHEALGVRHGATLQQLAATQAELATEKERAAERETRLAARATALLAAEARLREQDDAMKHKDIKLQALQSRFDNLAAALAAAPDQDDAARLRQEVTALGDQALALLGAEAEAAPTNATAVRR